MTHSRGTRAPPTDVPPGYTLAELSLLVLGAAVGASRLLQVGPSRDASWVWMFYWQLWAPFGLAGAGAPITPPSVVTLPLAGLLMAGSIIAIMRWLRGVANGPGLVLWALMGAFALPYWVVAPAFHSRSELDWFWLVLFGPAILPWIGMSIGITLVGTGVCLYQRRDRLMGWVGVVLAWAWIGCFIAAGCMQ